VRSIPTARAVGIPTAGAVVESRLLITYISLIMKMVLSSNGKNRDNYCLAVALEELDVAMLTSRARCSNDVKICVGQASVAAAPISCIQNNVADSILTKV
jgi:hypothetical protein